MALTTAITIEELGRVSAAAFLSQTLRMALVNHASAPATDAGICAWLAGELTGAYGYTRASRTISSNGAYDSGVDARWELPDQDFAFSASGGSIIYTNAVLLVGAAATGIVATIAADTAVNEANNTLTVTGHGLANGTKVTVRPEGGGALPTGLTAGSVYYAKVIDSNTIKLASDAATNTVVDITAVGSGQLSLIDCSGSVHSIWTENPARTILSGQAYTYRWSPFVND